MALDGVSGCPAAARKRRKKPRSRAESIALPAAAIALPFMCPSSPQLSGLQCRIPNRQQRRTVDLEPAGRQPSQHATRAEPAPPLAARVYLIELSSRTCWLLQFHDVPDRDGAGDDYCAIRAEVL